MSILEVIEERLKMKHINVLRPKLVAVLCETMSDLINEDSELVPEEGVLFNTGSGFLHALVLDHMENGKVKLDVGTVNDMYMFINKPFDSDGIDMELIRYICFNLFTNVDFINAYHRTISYASGAGTNKELGNTDGKELAHTAVF